MASTELDTQSSATEKGVNKHSAIQTFSSEHFINRELSSLEFNSRVLEEAEDCSNPLLERLKFLAIVSSNLDEFFMIRVSGLREQAFSAGAPQDKAADGMAPLAQLEAISQRTRQIVARQYTCWNDSVRPALKAAGIEILETDKLKKKQRQRLDKFFRDTASLVLTPMAIDPSHPNPQYHNQGLYLATELKRRKARGPKILFAVVQLPAVLPRLVPLGNDKEPKFIFLEEVVASRLPELFGGYDVLDWTTFRITRDGDIDLLDQEADDMLHLIEERLRARRRADAVRLEVPTGSNKTFLKRLVDKEGLRGASNRNTEKYSEVYHLPGPLDLRTLMDLAKISNFDHLREPPFTPRTPRQLVRNPGENLFSNIARRDILLHHPYDSFDPVIQLVRTAATDQHVLAIKQTLYRTSGDSPIVQALIEAAENGKHVTALVELKARFDEAANVNWAREMERAGVHVVYGFMHLKTHCKLSLIVRREGERLRRYVHLSTGNYHPTTAKLYTDMGLFTADEDMAADASALFNLLTGYSQGHQWRKIVVAPDDLHRKTIDLIREQSDLAEQGLPSRIFAKLNSLVDRHVIEALYRASHAGVPIDLIVRGICCLRPGMKGLSENIRVCSIVDRLLEHSRVFVFGTGNNSQIYLSSADWMPRNFHRRVEAMFPIDNDKLRQRVLKEIVPAYLRDNVKTRLLHTDASYEPCQPTKDDVPFRSQQELLQLHEQKDSKNPTPSSA
ncbi:MAG: polyphosphate kinase 1 [Planctomycetaceae bacterium]|nr:polyphosphate kinase 1 [Planctomycetaceae bacterium]MBP60106.1 polyphosphate kinase 1 [Planctomycetaceae bacterium]